MPSRFPPLNWLGFGLDLTRVSPFDVATVSRSVKKAHKIINTRLGEENHTVKIDDVEYVLPDIVGISTDLQTTNGDYVTFSSGTEASMAFESNSSLAVRFLAVSGSSTVSYGVRRIFRHDLQFSLYSMNTTTYLATLEDYADRLVVNALESRLNSLPPFSSDMRGSDLEDYKHFFDTFGSHIITGTLYGSRVQLIAWASNSNTQMNEHWSVSVRAAFKGIIGGIGAAMDSTNEHHYRSFENQTQRIVSFQGGDQALAMEALSRPDDPEKFARWKESSLRLPNVTGFHVTALWNLMRGGTLDNPAFRNRADDLERAFNHLTAHPLEHRTPVTLIIHSDWGEFRLLSADARVVVNNDHPPPQGSAISDTGVFWGAPVGPAYYNSIRFFVVNDGLPIDFFTGHGDDNGRGQIGSCNVHMAGRVHMNDQRGVDGKNMKLFLKQPVFNSCILIDI